MGLSESLLFTLRTGTFMLMCHLTTLIKSVYIASSVSDVLSMALMIAFQL